VAIRTSTALSCFMSTIAVGLLACSRKTPELSLQQASAVATETIAPRVDARRILNADGDESNWLSYGRTYSEQRFSLLSQINATSVNRLSLAWHYDLGTDERGQESTPIAVDGTLFVTTSWSKVIALNAATGALKWQFDPKVSREWAVNACCDVVNRGVAVWGDKVFVATIDGRLVAIRAATGIQVWQSLVVDRTQRYSITGAPRAVGGRILIGSAGGEFGVRGFLAAYDADSGKLLWRFYTVPDNPNAKSEADLPQEVARTWTGQWWTHGGGGAVWDAMAYDPTLDLLYFGTGNGAPWPRSLRSPRGGDNLYISSILAIRPATREYVWHYQTTPGDEWGYDAASPLILAELIIDGRLRSVLLQASANGFLYVLDRANGSLISATPFVPTSWATRIDMATGRPVEASDASYDRKAHPFLARPGRFGAHSWHPMAFDPTRGLLFVPAMENATMLSVEKTATPSRFSLQTGVVMTDSAQASPPSSRISAWDPIARKEVWRAAHDSPIPGGLLATAGNLVFQGSTTGHMTAYRSDDGKQLWSTNTMTAIMAAPITYAVKGRQYIAVMAGIGGGMALGGGNALRSSAITGGTPRLLVYALDGDDILPPTISNPAASHESATPELTNAISATKQGEQLYSRYCASCHGVNAISAGPLPDLRRSPIKNDSVQWERVVHAGLLQDRGMPGYFPEINPSRVESIRHYILARGISD
jgi:quinohemoprotein ethanol dehydrogenase